MDIKPIETARLFLKPLRLSDADGLFSGYLSDPRAAEFLSWRACATPAEARDLVADWLAYAVEHPDYACWTVRRSSAPIGTVVLNGGELGYGFGSAFWGMGYATEAARAVSRYALDELGMDVLRASRDARNERSGRVLEKIGMRRAGAEGGSVLYELRRPTVDAALGFARDLFRGDASGHDWFHTLRVYKTAMAIRGVEGGDAEVVALAAILHDADDPKLFSGNGYPNARAFLTGHPKSEAILGAIATVSFKGTGSVRPNTLEGMIVQDADRLDAIGAIGVARAFAYGGSRGRTMHDPDAPVRETMTEAEYRASESTTVNHFHEKLFKLKSLMNTAEGKRRAEGRDLYMRAFLDQFLREWDGGA